MSICQISTLFRRCLNDVLSTSETYVISTLNMDVDSVPSNFVSLKLTLSGRHLIDLRDRRCFDVVSTSIVYRQISRLKSLKPGVQIIAGIATIAHENLPRFQTRVSPRSNWLPPMVNYSQKFPSVWYRNTMHEQ